MATPFVSDSYTLFRLGLHLVVVGKSGSMADFSFLKKKWQNSLDLLTEKVA
mgnify:CR=1 FL=1